MPPDGPPPAKPRRPRLVRGQRVYVARAAATRACGLPPAEAIFLRYSRIYRGFVDVRYDGGEVAHSPVRRRLVFLCEADALNYRGP